GYGLSRRPRLLHAGRFQAAGRLGLRPPRSSEFALHFHPEEVRASRASAPRDRGERAGAGVGAGRNKLIECSYNLSSRAKRGDEFTFEVQQYVPRIPRWEF